MRELWRATSPVLAVTSLLVAVLILLSATSAYPPWLAQWLPISLLHSGGHLALAGGIFTVAVFAVFRQKRGEDQDRQKRLEGHQLALDRQVQHSTLLLTTYYLLLTPYSSLLTPYSSLATYSLLRTPYS